MDFRQFIDRVASLGTALQRDARFKAVFELHRPFPATDFDDLEQALADDGLSGYHIQQIFRDSYGVANGLLLQWQYLPGGSLAVTTASARIAIAPAVFLPENLPPHQASRLFDEPRVWDAVGPDDHVALRFHRDRESPDLLYFADVTSAYHPLTLNLETYLETLLEARAMYRWQQFFVDDSRFPLSRERAEGFRVSLKAIFPEADAARFVGKQER